MCPICTIKTIALGTLLGQGWVVKRGVACSGLPLLLFLYGLDDSILLLGNHPSVYQAAAGGMNLGSLTGVMMDATALQGDF